jgi:SAM-dependent methyltransferase
MTRHWTDAYYGALYLDTVEDLLSPALSSFEADVIAALLALGSRERVLDLACGHGRHARVLAGRVGAMVGVDRSAAYLRRARAASTAEPTRYLQADLRALPLRSASFDAAYSWYASLFMFDDVANAAALAEVARVVRPGGRLLVHHANPLALARNPHETARRTLADGSGVEEESVFDPDRGVDRCTRRLVRPGGGALEATAHLRYYKPTEWRTLARAAGLRLVRITSTTDAAARRSSELGPEAPDLIAVLEKPT